MLLLRSPLASRSTYQNLVDHAAPDTIEWRASPLAFGAPWVAPGYFPKPLPASPGVGGQFPVPYPGAQHDTLFDLGQLAYVPGRVYVCKTWADLAQTYTFLCCSRRAQSEPTTVSESHTGGSNNKSKYTYPDIPNIKAKPPSIELRRRLECTRNLHGKAPCASQEATWK